MRLSSASDSAGRREVKGGSLKQYHQIFRSNLSKSITYLWNHQIKDRVTRIAGACGGADGNRHGHGADYGRNRSDSGRGYGNLGNDCYAGRMRDRNIGRPECVPRMIDPTLLRKCFSMPFNIDSVSGSNSRFSLELQMERVGWVQRISWEEVRTED